MTLGIAREKAACASESAVMANAGEDVEDFPLRLGEACQTPQSIVAALPLCFPTGAGGQRFVP